LAEPLTTSDKSGDQISPSTSELDQNANSSAAATAFSSGGIDNNTAPLLTTNNSSTAASPPAEEEEEANRGKKRPNLNLNLNFHTNAAAVTAESTALKSLRTPDIQQYLNVPWDMPKLKKRVQARRNKFCFSGQASSPETSPQKESLPRSPDVELILRGESTAKDAADGAESWSIIVSNNNNNNNNNNNTKVTLSGGRGKENTDCENAPASLMSTSEDYSADQKGSTSAASPFPRPDERSNAVVKSTRKESSAFIASSSSSGRNGCGLKLSMASRALEGSDSGISMSSQQELLEVPWSMPKHKRKMAASWGRTAEASTEPLVRPSLRLPLTASSKLEQSADCCANKEISCSDEELDAVEMTKPNSQAEAEDDVAKSSTDSEADLLLQPLPFAMPKLERRLREGAPPLAVPFCRPLELTRPGEKPALQLLSESPFKRGTAV
jgi:hypothetical protein